MSAPADRQGGPLRLSALGLLILSAAVIALELALMRCMAVARWHNFSYLVISTALLGFGAAGTALFFIGPWLERRFSLAALCLCLLFALSVTASFRAAQALPLDVRYVLYNWRQAGMLFAHDSLLVVPFFFGALVVGLSLMHFGGRAHLVYGANLVGSGLGALLGLGMMSVLSSAQMLHAVAGAGMLAAVPFLAQVPARRAGRLARALSLAVAAWLVAEAAALPLELRIDQYKDLSTMRRWEADGNARLLTTRHGPRGRLDVYESPLLHHVLFAGLATPVAPPPQLAILLDGNMAATVLRTESAEGAAILDHTPMSLAYRLVERPRVLLLGETGGANVWLARRFGAEHITVVQPNPQLVDLMRGSLAGLGGSVLDGPDVTVITAGLRAYLERTEQRFDVIQIVETEGQAAGVSGMLSLREDFLLTVEGMTLCLGRLTERGVVSVTRGVQAPPRDNVKLFATLRAALARTGEADPGGRLVQARNYLAATTLAFARPPSNEQCRTLESAAGRLALDVEWAPCPDVRYGAQVNEVDGPPGQPFSWFHHAAGQLLSPERAGLYGEWVYDIRPATDDSPYFYDFFKWKSLPRFVRTYGQQWLARLELGYVVLVFALVQAVVVGAVLILLPVFRLRRRGGARNRMATLCYFTCLGLGYLMLEMVCILKFTYFLGDPIYAAAGVLTAFLVFSGLGSALSRRFGGPPVRAIRIAALGVPLLAAFYAFGLGPVFRACIGLPLGARMAVAVALVAPAAFLMGALGLWRQRFCVRCSIPARRPDRHRQRLQRGVGRGGGPLRGRRTALRAHGYAPACR